MSKIKVVCEECGQSFLMGVSGVSVDGKNLCDVCAKVSRNSEGMIVEISKVRPSILEIALKWLLGLK